MSRYPHFSEEEFRLAVPSCDIDQMEPSFMEQIEKIRSFSGVPMHDFHVSFYGHSPDLYPF